MPDSQPCVKWADGGGFRFRTRARVFYVKTAETRVSGGCINLGGKDLRLKICEILGEMDDRWIPWTNSTRKIGNQGAKIRRYLRSSGPRVDLM